MLSSIGEEQYLKDFTSLWAMRLLNTLASWATLPDPLEILIH